eukprot:1801282-Prymnesium_polylepis.1
MQDEHDRPTALRTRLAHGVAAALLLSRDLLLKPAPARLTSLASRSCVATAVLVTHEYVERALRRTLRSASLLQVSRGEWAVAVGCGLTVTLTGALVTRRLGAKPALGLPFLVIPTLYSTVSSREHLVLLRSSRPQLHEAGLCAAVAALPQLLVLPPALRPLVLPLIGVPVVAAWFAKAEDAARGGAESDPRQDVWSSACVLFGGEALRRTPAMPTPSLLVSEERGLPPSPLTLTNLARACPSLPAASSSSAISAVVSALHVANGQRPIGPFGIEGSGAEAEVAAVAGDARWTWAEREEAKARM